MNDETGGLVDHDQVRIFEQHDERDRLGQDLERLGCGHAHVDRIALAKPQALFGSCDAAHGDTAIVDQPLHLRTRQAAHRRRDHRVQASPRLRGIYNQSQLMTRVACIIGIIVVVYQIFDLT
jgi:hypothetical protein